MPIVEVAYSPNDYYYITSGKYDDISELCKSTYIKDLDKWNSDCCVDYPDKTNSEKCPNWNQDKCYEFEVCKNKEYAGLANTLENNSSGSSERYNNLKKEYQNEIIKTINISASIFLITYLSVYFFKS
jgi:hypothetical protein